MLRFGPIATGYILCQGVAITDIGKLNSTTTESTSAISCEHVHVGIEAPSLAPVEVSETDYSAVVQVPLVSAFD